jgi:hypothetical protein
MTDRKRTTLLALLALLGAVALLAAGCGGGSDESSGSTETTVETTTDQSTETMDTESTETESTDTESSGGGSAFASKDCLQLASIGAEFSKAMGGTDASDSVETTSKFFDALVAKAPDEIKDDLATLASAWKEVATQLKGIDLTSGATPSPETLQKLQEIGKKFDTPELQKASQNIEAWAKDNCGSSG